jgi:hypothetical protein
MICAWSDTSMGAAEDALREVAKAKDRISPLSLSLPVSDSGLTITKLMAEIVQSLCKLIEMADDFSKVGPVFHHKHIY